MFNCVLIDDEPNALEGLKKHFEKIDRFQIDQTFTNSLHALDYINRSEGIDLLLVDIDMPNLNGIELIQAVRGKVKKIVITTAYSSYTFDGFEVQADGFLLKPFPLSKLIGILNRLFPPIDYKYEDENSDYFFVKNRDEQMSYVKVKYNQVIYVESKLNYVHIYTTNGNLKTYSSLSELSIALHSTRGFLQLHRSFVVNIEHINSVIGNMVLLSNGSKITTGDKYKSPLINLIQKKIVTPSIKRLS